MMRNQDPNIFLFTGQGAQYAGMATSLYLGEPVFRQWMDDLDRICLAKNISVTRFLYPGSHGGGVSENAQQFDVVVSHPALFMVQFSLAKTLIHYGIIPDFLMGTSLGEYVALALAGVMSPQAMLGALIDHARALGTRCAPGAMIGIADSPGRYRDPVIRRNSSLAGISSPRHFLVSGDKGGMDKVRQRLIETDTGFHELPVRFGFHSPNIEPALPDWKMGVKNMGEKLTPPKINVISCSTGRGVKRVSSDFLTRIGRGPILFPKALRTLDREMRSQSRASGPVNILDLGPGAWSSGFVRQNKILEGPLRIYRVMTRGSELKNMKKIKGALIP